MDFIISKINNRNICLGGIGKLFYEQGLPIEISLIEMKERGIDVSFLHIADELYKHGWTKKTILRALSTGDGYLCDIEPIIKFINAATINDDRVNPPGRELLYSSTGYEAQRGLIFDYLFNNDWDEAKNFYYGLES